MFPLAWPWKEANSAPVKTAAYYLRSLRRTPDMALSRRFPIGAECQSGGGVHFRVWAPRRTVVEVVLPRPGNSVRLEQEGNGYFSGLSSTACPGDLYAFRLDGGEKL